MGVYLTDELVSRASRAPVYVAVDGQTYELSRRTAIHPIAVLGVYRDGECIGYLTPYGRDEYGACSVRWIGHSLPALFREVAPAIREIVKG